MRKRELVLCSLYGDQTFHHWAVVINVTHPLSNYEHIEVVSSGGAPTPAGTSVFTKHNWDMGMGYFFFFFFGLMGGAFIT